MVSGFLNGCSRLRGTTSSTKAVLIFSSEYCICPYVFCYNFGELSKEAKVCWSLVLFQRTGAVFAAIHTPGRKAGRSTTPHVTFNSAAFLYPSSPRTQWLLSGHGDLLPLWSRFRTYSIGRAPQTPLYRKALELGHCSLRNTKLPREQLGGEQAAGLQQR